MQNSLPVSFSRFASSLIAVVRLVVNYVFVVASIGMSALGVTVAALVAAFAVMSFGFWPPTDFAQGMAVLAFMSLAMILATAYFYLEFLEGSWPRLLGVGALVLMVRLERDSDFLSRGQLLVTSAMLLSLLVGGALCDVLRQRWLASRWRRVWLCRKTPGWLRNVGNVFRQATVFSVGILLLPAAIVVAAQITGEDCLQPATPGQDALE